MQLTQIDHTPLMKQYHEIKAQYDNALVLFQVGDFYELFYDDAKNAAACLGIALTARGKNKGEPIPLCGVPVHAIEHYLHKLVKNGFNVVLCDQLEPPKPGTVVKRGVTRVYTPGTLTDSSLLDEKSPSYLLTLVPTDNQWALLFGELMTAQLFATSLPAGSERALESELLKFFPDEIVLPSRETTTVEGDMSFRSWLRKRGYCITVIDAISQQDHAECDSWIRQQFKASVQSTIQQDSVMQEALYYFYAYMRKNQATALAHFNTVEWYRPEDFLLLDGATQRNLEIIHPYYDGNRLHTLFATLDCAHTPMGSRMIKKWLQRPLLNQKAIEQRFDMVEYFMRHITVMRSLEQCYKQLGDVERIVGRIALGRGQLHDYIALKRALALVPSLKQYIGDAEYILGTMLANLIGDFSSLYATLHAALPDDATLGGLIRDGFDATLDHLRGLTNSAHQHIINLERAEQEATGISSLKVRYNQVYGYYIEITKTNAHLVPPHYIRQQTLVGRERYMTPELQRLQLEIIHARNQITDHEKMVFETIKKEVARYINQLRKSTHALAYADALLSFAHTAYQYGYVRPTFNDQRMVRINAGRHPVVERSRGATFIPNDTVLHDEQSLLIITGPNMGGKSTYLRQVALISIMAQAGSFVPAQSADMPLFDRIFTRIGAGDNVAGGKSTFLVEMEETGEICIRATRNSLVIFDEIGRGTSTYDGLAIAQAVVEYMHHTVGARCLFATHYHELTQLPEKYPGIVNFYAASKKTEQGILLLYTMLQGIADGSFGIEVAKIAQLPRIIIDRSQELLKQLEHSSSTYVPSPTVILPSQLQKLNDVESQKNETEKKILRELKAINYDHLSPKQAFDLLWRLKDSLCN